MAAFKSLRYEPSVKKEEHMLGINEDIHEPSLEALLKTAIYYKLSHVKASSLIQKVLTVTARWKARAKALGIAAADVHEMENLFIRRQSE